MPCKKKQNQIQTSKIIHKNPKIHTHTVILLHGLSSNSSSFDDFCDKIELFISQKTQEYSIKYIIPQSPKRTIHWPTGNEKNVNSWYDYFTDMSGKDEYDKIDITQLQEMTLQFQKLVQNQILQLGGDSSKIFIGGYSQGGTLAINVAMEMIIKKNIFLGGVLCLRSCLLDVTDVPKIQQCQQNLTQIFIIDGEIDDVFINKLTERSYKRFVDAGFSVTWQVIQDLDHYNDCKTEYKQIAEFLYNAMTKSIKYDKEKQQKIFIKIDQTELQHSLIVHKNTDLHTHSVIMLHGYTGESKDFEDFHTYIDQFLLSQKNVKEFSLKYIFPQAPSRTIHLSDEILFDQNAWHDYFIDNSGTDKDDEIDLKQWEEMTTYIMNLVQEEISILGGDPSKILIGGYSQGGTLAINVAMQMLIQKNIFLGGLLCLRTNLLDITEVPKLEKNRYQNQTQIFIFEGELDSQFIQSKTSKSYQRFIDNGHLVTWQVLKDLGHSEDTQTEYKQCAEFIQNLLNDKRYNKKTQKKKLIDVPPIQQHPPLIIQDNKEQHTHTVILMHSMYMEANDWSDFPNQVNQILKQKKIQNTSIKYVFPQGPKRTIHWVKAYENYEYSSDEEEEEDVENEFDISSWYDYVQVQKKDINDLIDVKQFQQMTDYIQEIVQQEMNLLGGDASKIIIAGSSQGGTIAINVFMQMIKQKNIFLGGLICLRTCLLEVTDVPKLLPNQITKNNQIFLFIAELDDTYTSKLTSVSYKRLGRAGFNIKKQIEKGLTHEDDSYAETQFFVDSIVDIMNN